MNQTVGFDPDAAVRRCWWHQRLCSSLQTDRARHKLLNRRCDAPELIILDEATEGLAPLIVLEIWRVIGEIRGSGIATLIVDRDYRRVLARSDRALVLQKGQVVLQGRAQEVSGSAALAGYLGV